MEEIMGDMMAGTKIKLISKRLTLTGVIVSLEDDSDTQIANVEDWLLIKTDDKKVYAFRGKYGHFQPKAKTLQNYGSFRLEKIK